MQCYYPEAFAAVGLNVFFAPTDYAPHFPITALSRSSFQFRSRFFIQAHSSAVAEMRHTELAQSREAPQ